MLHIVEMKLEDRIKIFRMLFAPKSGEKVLFLVDVSHDNINDSEVWAERRAMILEWYKTFKEMGVETGFTVDILEYPATGYKIHPFHWKSLMNQEIQI